ncbi:MAG: aldehyde dehydrogenase family protein, partial [Mesorhizobium sp.]
MLRHLKQPERFAALDRLARQGDRWDGSVFQVFNPSTSELLAELPDMGAEQTKAAIDRAYVAQAKWAALTARDRSDTLWRWHQLILDHT